MTSVHGIMVVEKYTYKQLNMIKRNNFLSANEKELCSHDVLEIRQLN